MTRNSWTAWSANTWAWSSASRFTSFTSSAHPSALTTRRRSFASGALASSPPITGPGALTLMRLISPTAEKEVWACARGMKMSDRPSYPAFPSDRAMSCTCT